MDSLIEEFSEPYLAYISEHLPKRLRELSLDLVPMVVFAKGAWYALDSLCNLGYQVVGLDWLQDPAEAVKIRGNRPIVFQGNADPGILYGSREAISVVVERMVKGFGGGKQGWIANLGHGEYSVHFLHRITDGMIGITPFVNPEDLRFYFQEIHRLAGS